MPLVALSPEPEGRSLGQRYLDEAEMGSAQQRWRRRRTVMAIEAAACAVTGKDAAELGPEDYLSEEAVAQSELPRGDVYYCASRAGRAGASLPPGWRLAYAA